MGTEAEEINAQSIGVCASELQMVGRHDFSGWISIPYPAREETVNSRSSLKVYVRDSHPQEAKLRPIVLLHGLSRSSSFFNNLTRQYLAEGRRVLSVDLSNTGLTLAENGILQDFDLQRDAQIVASIVERFRMPRFTLLGHSRGGGVALTLAAQLGKQVKNLILVNTYVEWLGSSLLNPWTRILMKPSVKESLQRRPQDEVPQDRRVTFDLEVAGVLETLTSMAGANVYVAARNISPETKVVIVGGEKDTRLAPKELLEKLKAEIPGSELVMSPAGHYVPTEDAELVLAVTRRLR